MFLGVLINLQKKWNRMRIVNNCAGPTRVLKIKKYQRRQKLEGISPYWD